MSIDVRHDDNDEQRFHAIVYRLRDQVHAQDVKLAEQVLSLHALSTTVEMLRCTMATSEQLKMAVEMLGVKLDGLRENVEPLKKAMHWFVGLVGTAVILAVLGLVLKR